MREEGHYTIKRVTSLPKKGNSNFLYSVKGVQEMQILYRWLLNGSYEEIVVGSGGVGNITGLILPGTNITITGTGTLGDPYIVNSAGGGGATNLAVDTITATNLNVTSDTGTDATLPTATNAVAGVMSAAQVADLEDVITLTGVAGNSTDLGTFPGIVISDNVDIYTALSELEARSIISPTGLERLDEGKGDGWRLIGKDPANYGNIGTRATDLSNSTSASTTKGSTGTDSFTVGRDNENGFATTLMYGQDNLDISTAGSYSAGNLLGGAENQFGNFLIGTAVFGERSTIGRAGVTDDDNVVFLSLMAGGKNDLYAGHGSAQIGDFLVGGASASTIVGVGNLDETVTIAANDQIKVKAEDNPRFTVGCGIYAGTYTSPGVFTRRNGFVVWGDGNAKFPTLTNTMIDAANDDSAVTKGGVNVNAGGLSGSGNNTEIATFNAAGDLVGDSTFTYAGSVATITNLASSTRIELGHNKLEFVNNTNGDFSIVGDNVNLTQDVFIRPPDTAGSTLATPFVFATETYVDATVVDLTTIPEYVSIVAATAALGTNARFRWAEANIDGVTSPSGSQYGITK